MPRKTAVRKGAKTKLENTDDQEGTGRSLVGPGMDRHTSLEDGDPFGFQNTLRKAMEISADPKLWEGLVLNSDGLPDLNELDITYASTHDKDGKAVDLNVHGKGGVTDAVLPPDATIINFGQRRSGKSYFTREFMFYMAPFFPRGICFSDTDRMLHHYDTFMPKKYIYPGYIWTIQKAANEMQRAFKEDTQNYDRWKEIDEHWMRTFTIYDDVINKEGAFHYKEGDPLRRIFVNGRHFENLLLFNTQYPRAIPPTMRANIDWAFLFPARGKNEAEILFELVGGPLQKPSLFSGTLAAHTEDFAMLAVNNQQSARTIMDRYQWYRADDWDELLAKNGMKEGDFKLGCPEYQAEAVTKERLPAPVMRVY